MSKQIRTRFAPSPTGYLHVGGLRTALFNYLFARSQDGEFVLRIEDTDRERFIENGTAQIIESMSWAGISPDEGPNADGEEAGDHGPYAQSARKEVLGSYANFAHKLIDAGLAYYSQVTPEELTQLREEAQREKRPFLYRKAMESRDGQEGEWPIRIDIEAFCAQLSESDHFFKTAGGWAVRWQEPNGWKMDEWKLEGVDDFIILKADGYPTYNFANIIDDYEMKITHVLRGDEFVSSTPKHIVLYRALGLEEHMPTFLHLPPINGADGKKLSKRNGDANVLDYKERGYLPDALISSLALLGWNDGTTQEIYTMDELIAGFSLERVQKSPAVFDTERLNWVNGTLIRKLPLEELDQQAKDFWPQAAAAHDQEYRTQVLSLIQERLKYLDEIAELTHFFFEEPAPYQPREEERAWLEESLSTLNGSDFSEEDLETRLRQLADTLGLKPGKLFMALRQAVSGSKVSPGLFETLHLVGKDRVTSRIQHSLNT